MRTKCIAILLLLFPKLLIGQVVNDSILGTLYNQTMSIYFSKETENNMSDFWIVQTEFDKSKLVKNLKSKDITYIDAKTDKHRILEKPYSKNKGARIYRIEHKIINQDTIDVNIVYWTIVKASKKELSIAASCGGTMGYIPTARFIRNTNGIWRHISSD